VTQDNNDSPIVEECGREALAQVNGFLEAAGLLAQASISRIDEDIVNIDITGEEAFYLVGRRGGVIDALQYLILVMVTHDKPGTTRVRVHLDADNYRKRREESLKSLARSLADQVRATGEEAVLEPLNALERRIVHTELADDSDVSTYSEGEDPDRHIVITPRKPS